MSSSLSSGEPSDNDVPGILVDRGWRQGTVFHAPGIELWCIETVADDGEERLAARPRITPSDGRFVVVSQTCDIAAAIVKEPVVEALACNIEPDRTVRATLNKSFRWFEIDRGAGLIAHAMYRVPFDKRALLTMAPDAWPDTSERLDLFSRWLARRASRSALPDSVVAAFVRPLRRVLDALKRKQPDDYQAFNDAVEEIRLGLPEHEAPPFDIHLMLLLSGNELSKDQDDAIELVCTGLREALVPAEARLGDVMKMTKSRMSVELYRRTALVDLEHVTYAGDDILGAEPSVPL